MRNLCTWDFDKEESALALIRAAGKKKGIDVSQMEGVDFAAFKETQYDILAAELRKHLDMKKYMRFWKKEQEEQKHEGAA